MNFKNPQVDTEFHNSIPIFLMMIVKDADDFCKQSFGKEMMITRVLERIDGDSGVHEAQRGVDARDEFGGGFIFTRDEISKILEYINGKYHRYDKFPTLIHHSFAAGPFHLHFQLAPTMTAYIPPRAPTSTAS